MDQNPTETSVQRPRQDTSGDVKVPMTQDAMTKKQSMPLKHVYILSIVSGNKAVGSRNKT